MLTSKNDTGYGNTSYGVSDPHFLILGFEFVSFVLLCIYYGQISGWPILQLGVELGTSTFIWKKGRYF